MSTSVEAVHVTVVYPAAGKPFQDEAASSEETLASLKACVLEAFELTEGSTPDGNITTYVLFRGNDRLEDLTRTIGDISGGNPAIQLKLAQQIIQGVGM